MRITIPIVIEMTDGQVKAYADEYGLPVPPGDSPVAGQARDRFTQLSELADDPEWLGI